jgi:dolichol-phosphate mannosyltransferase
LASARGTPDMVIIILPAYNEERALGALLSAIDDAMKARQGGYRVVVVDDGSSDDTGAVAQRSSASMPVTLLEHERNGGLGESIRTGLLYAVGQTSDRDTIVTMDADNTHTPALIDRMVAAIGEGNDVVIASRYRPGARIKGVPAYRRALSWCGNMLFRIVFPTPNVRDFTSGYRAYRASILKQAFDIYGDQFVSQTGFSCMVDILLNLRRLDAIMSEVPLVLRYDLKLDVSKMLVVRTIGTTLRLMVRRRIGRR